MTLVTDLDLPLLDVLADELRGERYRETMAAISGHDGWLARSPFGFVTLDRDAGEFFLRHRSVTFPSVMLSELAGVVEGPLHDEITKNIISTSGADHARLRSLVNPALTPKRVERYRPAMREFLTRLLDGLPASGEVEFIGDFAKPYPSQVIAHVMGAPLADADRLHYWSNVIQKQFDAPTLFDPERRKPVEEAVIDCYAYVDALIDSRRSDPGEDLITDLIGAEEQGDKLTQDELRNLILDILVGGVDTSQSQLAHAIRLLAANPDQWELLRSDPHALALSAVEEALRYEPITAFTARLTLEPIEYRGITFPENTVVLISAWHANRDGVTDPDRFDITADRDGARVLTFGAGIHYCVGANLARAEIQEGLAFLAEHITELRLGGEPEFGTPSGIYGLDRLPLVLTR
jgi:cytochrome P450